jgi:hypothetical protein
MIRRAARGLGAFGRYIYRGLVLIGQASAPMVMPYPHHHDRPGPLVRREPPDHPDLRRPVRLSARERRQWTQLERRICGPAPQAGLSSQRKDPS